MFNLFARTIAVIAITLGLAGCVVYDPPYAYAPAPAYYGPSYYGPSYYGPPVYGSVFIGGGWHGGWHRWR